MNAGLKVRQRRQGTMAQRSHHECRGRPARTLGRPAPSPSERCTVCLAGIPRPGRAVALRRAGVASEAAPRRRTAPPARSAARGFAAPEEGNGDPAGAQGWARVAARVCGAADAGRCEAGTKRAAHAPAGNGRDKNGGAGNRRRSRTSQRSGLRRSDEAGGPQAAPRARGGQPRGGSAGRRARGSGSAAWRLRCGVPTVGPQPVAPPADLGPAPVPRRRPRRDDDAHDGQARRAGAGGRRRPGPGLRGGLGPERPRGARCGGRPARLLRRGSGAVAAGGRLVRACRPVARACVVRGGVGKGSPGGLAAGRVARRVRTGPRGAPTALTRAAHTVPVRQPRVQDPIRARHWVRAAGSHQCLAREPSNHVHADKRIKVSSCYICQDVRRDRIHVRLPEPSKVVKRVGPATLNEAPCVGVSASSIDLRGYICTGEATPVAAAAPTQCHGRVGDAAAVSWTATSYSAGHTQPAPWRAPAGRLSTAACTAAHSTHSYMESSLTALRSAAIAPGGGLHERRLGRCKSPARRQGDQAAGLGFPVGRCRTLHRLGMALECWRWSAAGGIERSPASRWHLPTCRWSSAYSLEP